MCNLTDTAVVISDGNLIFFYTDFYCDDGFLVVYNGVSYLLTDGRYIESAKAQAKAECYLQSECSLLSLLKHLKVEKVGLVYGYSSIELYKRLEDNGYCVFDYTNEYNLTASVKSSEQLFKIKKACEICEEAFLKTLPFIKEGVTELEVAGELEYNFKKLGSNPAFETIVAFGKNTSVPHHQTGKTKLLKNMPVLMDFGCTYQGFCSDMTRTMFYGKPTDKFTSVYDLVLKAHLKASERIVSGMKASDADKIARDYLNGFNLGEYFAHSLGHGIGVKIHEYPTLSAKSSAVLKDNMVFSIEPGVYLQGEFGIRIEDTYTLSNSKCVSFMTMDKNPIILNG